MKIKVKSKFGEYLDERGISQTYIAKKIKVTNAMVNKWCKNDKNGQAVSTPSTGYMLRLENLLNCTVSDLFEEIDETDL